MASCVFGPGRQARWSGDVHPLRRSTNKVLSREANSPERGLGTTSPLALTTPPPLARRAGSWAAGRVAARSRAHLLPRAEGSGPTTSGLTTSGPREDATPEPPQARAGRLAVARRESKEAAPTSLRAARARPEARGRKYRTAGNYGPASPRSGSQVWPDAYGRLGGATHPRGNHKKETKVV